MDLNEKEASPPSQPTDYTQGYEVRLCFYSDRIEVKGPGPLPIPDESSADELDEPSADEASTLADALKLVVAIYKTHPLDTDEVSMMEAGFNEGIL